MQAALLGQGEFLQPLLLGTLDSVVLDEER